LERATVLQTWLSTHGQPVDVVVGVARESGTLVAHAWLASEHGDAAQYREIHRISPPSIDGGRGLRRGRGRR
jgi:hypothetical protein